MQIDSTPFSSLIELLSHIAHKAPSGRSFAEIAELMNKPYSTLSSELNSEAGSHKFGSGDLLLLMELTDSDDPVHFLAGKREGIFVKVPKLEAGNPIYEASFKALKEFGELMATQGEALKDKKLNTKEKKDVLREGYEAVQATLELLKCVEAMEVNDD